MFYAIHSTMNGIIPLLVVKKQVSVEYQIFITEEHLIKCLYEAGQTMRSYKKVRCFSDFNLNTLLYSQKFGYKKRCRNYSTLKLVFQYQGKIYLNHNRVRSFFIFQRLN